MEVTNRIMIDVSYSYKVEIAIDFSLRRITKNSYFLPSRQEVFIHFRHVFLDSFVSCIKHISHGMNSLRESALDGD